MSASASAEPRASGQGGRGDGDRYSGGHDRGAVPLYGRADREDERGLGGRAGVRVGVARLRQGQQAVSDRDLRQPGVCVGVGACVSVSVYLCACGCMFVPLRLDPGLVCVRFVCMRLCVHVFVACVFREVCFPAKQDAWYVDTGLFMNIHGSAGMADFHSWWVG